MPVTRKERGTKWPILFVGLKDTQQHINKCPKATDPHTWVGGQWLKELSELYYLGEGDA